MGHRTQELRELRRRRLGRERAVLALIRCAVRVYGRRWVLVFWVVLLPWRLECVYFSCAARLVGLLARASCQGGHRRQVMVPGSRKNGAAALKPETAARWCGAWRSCARRGSRTSVSDARGRRRGSKGRRAASTARSVDLRARDAAPGAALFSPIHDRPRYGSATRLWVITSFQERDYLAPMASRVRRGAQGRLLDMHRVDVRMTPYRWRPGGGALTGFNDVVTWPRWRLQPQHRRRQCV